MTCLAKKGHITMAGIVVKGSKSSNHGRELL
jgi:hypothetical protein